MKFTDFWQQFNANFLKIRLGVVLRWFQKIVGDMVTFHDGMY